MKNSTSSKKIAIIGGGAAGLMAAVTLAEAENFSTEFEGTIFEKNSYLGAKIIISGGGRCNVTTGIHDVKKLLTKYPRGNKFLPTALYQFPPDQVMNWFETHGVKLKTEEDLRVFPRSNNGNDIVDALEGVLREKTFHTFLKSQVKQIQYIKKQFKITYQTGEKSHEELFDAVIITTGGNAYRHTGSTGDGYAFAQELGHTITPLAPSLNSFIVEEKYIANLAGISFPEAKITLVSFDKQSTSTHTGPILFTHHGVTGPATFVLSSQLAYETYSKEKPLKLVIDLFPKKSQEDFEQELQKLANDHGKKLLINLLDFFLPKSLCPTVMMRANIKSNLVSSQMNKDQKKALISTLKNFDFNVVNRGAGEEFVTAGGVELSEVNPNTMESKITPGLYFAGEILNIDGYTGGFNLQASWATGRLAALSVIKNIEKSS